MATPAVITKRLMVELGQVQRIIKSSEPLGLLLCEPIDDNLMKWRVQIQFPKDSALQKGLDELAENVFDPARNCLELQVRFPIEYPYSPPEVWIKQPRLKVRSGNVTFGGKICNPLLTSASWSSAVKMSQVLEQLRMALLEAGAEVDQALASKRGYDPAPPALNRLSSLLIQGANSFRKENMMVLSAIEAGMYVGDLSRLEASDKIALPFEFAAEIYNLGDRVELPLMFEVSTRTGLKTHCAIFDFINGLPPEVAILPKWIMEDIFLGERDVVTIRSVRLELITYVKVQPHSVDFYKAVKDSGADVPTLLTTSLSRFSALTEDASVPIEIGAESFPVRIVALEPQGAVRIIDSDVQHSFEFKVDFEPAPDFEDEVELKSRTDALLAKYRAKQAEAESGQKAAEERKQAAKAKRFEVFLRAAKAVAGQDDGSEGSVHISLRLPGGGQLQAKFRDGVRASALVALALGSEWAAKAKPWGVQIISSFPRKVLQDDDVITQSMHRSALSVLEEAAPENEGELLQELASEAPAAAEPAGPLSLPRVLSGPSVVSEAQVDDDSPEYHELLERTSAAFNIQRFIQAGCTPEEAARRHAAGEVLPPSAAELVAARVGPTPAPALRRSVSAARPAPAGPPAQPAADDDEETVKLMQVEVVVNITGKPDYVCRQFLERYGWDVERAMNEIFDQVH